MPPGGDDHPKNEQTAQKQHQAAAVFASVPDGQAKSQQGRPQRQRRQFGEAGQPEEQADGQAVLRFEAAAQGAEHEQNQGRIQRHRQRIIVHRGADKDEHGIQRGQGRGGESDRRPLWGDVSADFIDHDNRSRAQGQAQPAHQRNRQAGAGQR